MMISTFPDMVFKAHVLSDLSCLLCVKTMQLHLSEPVSKGFEIRSYACLKCEALEEFVVEV